MINLNENVKMLGPWVRVPAGSPDYNHQLSKTPGLMPGRFNNNVTGGANNTNTYQYQGQQKDPQANWSQFELRMFNSDLGRWFTPARKEVKRAGTLPKKTEKVLKEIQNVKTFNESIISAPNKSISSTISKSNEKIKEKKKSSNKPKNKSNNKSKKKKKREMAYF